MIFRPVSHVEFIRARAKNTRLQFLPDNVSGMAFLIDDDTAGYALNGVDIQNVFNNGARGHGRIAIAEAILRGGATLTCYDGHLPKLFALFGFVEDQRLPFNRALAPKAWSYVKDGEPAVIFMKRVPPHVV